MSTTEETNVPKRRSSAANRRRRNRVASADAPVQESVQQSAVTPAEEAAAVERHLQRQQDRKAAKAQSEKKGMSKVVDGERLTGVRKFYAETMSEIRKVIWPDREQTRNLTLVVIAMSTVMGFLLGGIDYVLLKLFETIG